MDFYVLNINTEFENWCINLDDDGKAMTPLPHAYLLSWSEFESGFWINVSAAVDSKQRFELQRLLRAGTCIDVLFSSHISHKKTNNKNL